MTPLVYLSNLKWGMGLTFGTHFLLDSSVKGSLFNTLSIDKYVISLSSQNTNQTKCINNLFR